MCSKINFIVLEFLELQGSQTPISDMFYDLRDGTKLLSLLEVLTSKQFVRI